MQVGKLTSARKQLDKLVFFDSGTGTALMYGRNVAGGELTFRVKSKPFGVQTILTDEKTGGNMVCSYRQGHRRRTIRPDIGQSAVTPVVLVLRDGLESRY